MNKKKSTQKKLKNYLPSILAIIFLSAALIVGLLFLGEGFGVFIPRAKKSLQIENLRITNVTQDSFTVSFYTPDKISAFVKYSDDQDKLTNKAIDERDLVSSEVNQYNLHYITISELQPETTYYFKVYDEDNNETESVYYVTTAKEFSLSQSLMSAKTIYGNVSFKNGMPATGSIVYVKIDGAEEKSSLVKKSGGWIIPLSKTIKEDGSGYLKLEDDTNIRIKMQGTDLGQVKEINTTIEKAQPLKDITIDAQESGNVLSAQNKDDGIKTDDSTEQNVENKTQDIKQEQVTVLDLNEVQTTDKAVTSKQPKIVGKAAPQTEVKISIHSDTEIEEIVISEDSGFFELDLAEMGVELEPGEHSVTYTYTDPTLDQEVTKSHNFYVEDANGLIAQADNQNQPYGSGDPYPMVTATMTPMPITPTIQVTQAATPSVSPTPAELDQAGSVDSTMFILGTGLFFLITGVWSLWLSRQYN